MKSWRLTLIAISVALSACSGTPSDSQMSLEIASQFNHEFGTDFVKVKDLNQTRGHKDGKKRYVADVKYELEFTKSLNQVKDEAGPVQTMELVVMFGDFHRGDTKHMSNHLLFEKTDNKWVLTNSRRED